MDVADKGREGGAGILRGRDLEKVWVEKGGLPAKDC